MQLKFDFDFCTTPKIVYQKQNDQFFNFQFLVYNDTGLPEIFIDNKEFVEKLEKSATTFEIQADPDRTNFPHLCNDELSRVKLEEVTSLFVIVFLLSLCLPLSNFDQLGNTLARGRTVRPNLTNGHRAKGRKLEESIKF